MTDYFDSGREREFNTYVYMVLRSQVATLADPCVHPTATTMLIGRCQAPIRHTPTCTTQMLQQDMSQN